MLAERLNIAKTTRPARIESDSEHVASQAQEVAERSTMTCNGGRRKSSTRTSKDLAAAQPHLKLWEVALSCVNVGRDGDGQDQQKERSWTAPIGSSEPAPIRLPIGSA